MGGLKFTVWLVLVLGVYAQQSSLIDIQNAISRGDLDKAASMLEDSLHSYPNDAGLLNLRGVVHAQRHEFADARSDFERAVGIDPSLSAAWRNLGRVCQMDGSSNACADKAWRRVLRTAPDDGEAQRGLALALEREAKFQQSLDILARAAIDPKSQIADLMVRCLDLAGLKRTTDTLQMAQKLAMQSEFSNGDLLAMVPAGPQVTVLLAQALDQRKGLEVDGLKTLAVAYQQLGRLSEARTTLERVALAEPANEADLLELARVAEKQLDHEGALGYLGHARELAPENARVHFLFGMVAAEMNLPVEARRSFDKALELDPLNADYNYAMGAIILTTRDAATAGSYFQKYISVRPGDGKGHYALGVAEFTSGDYANAKDELDKALSDAEVEGAAEFFMGRIARLEGNLDAARQHLSKAIKMMPKFSESHTELARIAMLENNLEAAAAELKTALKLDDKSFQANSQLLVLYKRTHDAREHQQAEILKQLDEARSQRAELMLRTVEIRP